MWLNYILSTFLFIAPSPPQALRVDFINATTLSVVWDSPLAPNGIILNYALRGDSVESSVGITRESTDTRETFVGLAPATRYTVIVRGITSVGVGESANLIVTTLPCEFLWLYRCIKL